jgi:hypothetical protein
VEESLVQRMGAIFSAFFNFSTSSVGIAGNFLIRATAYPAAQRWWTSSRTGAMLRTRFTSRRRKCLGALVEGSSIGRQSWGASAALFLSLNCACWIGGSDDGIDKPDEGATFSECRNDLPASAASVEAEPGRSRLICCSTSQGCWLISNEANASDY